MKNVLMLACLLCSMFVFGQTKVTDGLYLFKDRKDAGMVYKVLATELKIGDRQMGRLRDAINHSAEIQVRLLRNPANGTPDKLNAMEAQQTVAIEKELKEIFGPDKYNIYLGKKAEITARVKKLEKR